VANEVLLRHNTDRFCSVVLLHLRREADQWRCTVSSAGHPLPLLRRRGASTIALGRSDVLLGVFDEVTYRDQRYELEPSDAVVAFTDGVTEARRGDEFFGDEFLHELLARDEPSANGLVAALLERVLDFQSGYPRDDIAIVSLVVPDRS
jgi:sigma-B regulation protein RsbU (phosphoserine phosphatase)